MIAPDVATAAGFGGTPPAGKAKIIRFTPFRNAAGTMAGFLSIETPCGMVIHGLKVIIGSTGTRWIAMPDAKRRDRDDQLVLDANGKPIWDAVIEFCNRDAGDRFGAMILQALREQHPEVFDGGAP
jgi:DNA-binding cell septation regulator SpoVG